MLKIEPHIKKYIDATAISLENRLGKRLGVSLEKKLGDRFDKRVDKAIDKAKKEFTIEMKRHTSALVEGVNNKAKEIEIVAKKLPSEGRIREIFREEMHPHVVEMNIYKEEALIFRDEMRALRLNVNGHEKSIMGHEERISSLELDAA